MPRFWIYFLLPLMVFAVPAPANRLPSTPFISGDTFRFFADFVFDELDTSLDPEKVSSGNTVFVKTDYLGKFFQEIHPRIKHPYILISHNSDDPAPGPYGMYLDHPNLKAWFAQNYDGYKHPKIHPIPIGLANSHWPHGNFHTVQKIQEKTINKKHLAYMNIAVGTYLPERKLVYTLLKNKRFCYQSSEKKYADFLKDLKSSTFAVAPRGNGLDTHRFWEALLMGTIPIVKTSPLDSMYEGLPVLVISDWHEVTEQFLRQKEAEIKHKPVLSEKLYIDYWLSLIDQQKE